VFEVSNVSVRAEDGGPLRATSLRLSAGEAVIVAGDRGACALLRAAAGLTPATTGAVRVDGEDVAGLPAHAVAAHGVAYVGPATRAFASLTVRENLVAAAAHAGPGRDARADALLAAFPGLDAGSPGEALDAGEATALAVAVAIARRPRVLLLEGLAADVAVTYARVATAEGASVLAGRRITSLADVDPAPWDRAYVVRRGLVKPWP
jgi:branched-chain amino acid transport system ATP-binding protein